MLFLLNRGVQGLHVRGADEEGGHHPGTDGVGRSG